MRDALYLAARYLRFSLGRTAVLIAGTAVTLFLPVFTWLAAERLEAGLLSRARVSPVLLGHAGNEVDLTLATLYFRSGEIRTVPFELGEKARSYGVAVPLYTRHTVGGAPLVGTDPDYYPARNLRATRGRLPAVIGEVVAGAAIAESFRLETGDQIRSDFTNLYNLSGAYPLLLDVVGVLERRGTPDDDAFFTDIKTTWALDGLFHGHEEVTKDNALNPDAEEDGNLEASAALFLFSEISASNRPTFHLHGDVGDAPATAFLVFPRGFPDDQKAHDQLLGDFALQGLYQAVRPKEVVQSLLDIVLRLRDALQTYFGLVAFSTVAFFLLIVSLTLRLRRSELRLMARMGCDRFTLTTLVGAEIFLVLSAAAIVSGLMVWLAMVWLSRSLGFV